ncbi:MAG: GNAT family N-acetyltransferase [Oscillospiraceae bacterium]|nr:GNAT family N-acetyltransferase [Oscillospiraceae bacterium]
MKIYKTLPDGVQIVEYEDSLAQAVSNMWNRSTEGWGGSFGYVYTPEKVIADNASGSFFNIYVAMKDGEALGYCSFDRYYKDADTAYVHVLNVRPDYHGKGIGKELVLMCVNETIARGLPRLDIHTWPGNTKAVPMYKKCGFQWEDRTDTTHLCNFIPTVLSTPLLKGYFENADWYGDSVRSIEIKPDGVKSDKFEFFEYQWEKDGKRLRVGFEKSGRRMRLIETDDYKIELTAANHEAAFGIAYQCKFSVENKSGAKLDVAITSKSDEGVSFNGSWERSVEKTAEFEGSFFAEAISDDFDPQRVHPCVLADVSVNGKRAEFGLGIEPKFPVRISLHRKQAVAKPNTSEDVYINIKNNLPSDAELKFAIVENTLLRLGQSQFETKLEKGKDAMLTTAAHILDCGYQSIPLGVKILMDNGEALDFSHPLHLLNQGLAGQFRFETANSYGAANGMWRISMDKKDNHIKFNRNPQAGYGDMPVSKLGKPYDDEFNITKPSDVRVRHSGAFTTFEADFVSEKFKGAILTEVYEFDASGTLRRSHRVENKGDKPLELFLESTIWTNIGKRPVFHHDGAFHKTADSMSFGFSNIDTKKVDENWMFEADDENPTGISWPLGCKALLEHDELLLEFELPGIAPGGSYETEPLEYMCGVFKNFRDFRNYALGLCDEAFPIAKNHLEFIANGGNPVLSSDALRLAVRNNRLQIRTGTVTVSSPDGLFSGASQENPDDEVVPENAFTVAVSPDKTGIGIAGVKLHLGAYEKEIKRALLIRGDTRVLTETHGKALAVTNGKVSFSVDPSHSDALCSLKFEDNQWIFSKYPSLEPYSWWNPFVGGLKFCLDRMSNSLVLRERITASFVSHSDKLGNTWEGIRTDVEVEKFDEYKGVRYSQYYLTLPGVPVMCHFVALHNDSGRYLDTAMQGVFALVGEDGFSGFHASLACCGNMQYHLSLDGNEEHELEYDRLAVFSHRGDKPRKERMYVYKDSVSDKGKSEFWYDNGSASCDFSAKCAIPNGSSYTTRPIFCILTEKELDADELTDLERISF